MSPREPEGEECGSSPTHVHVDRQVDAVLFPLDLEETVSEERLEIGHGGVGKSTCFACACRRLHHRCSLMAPEIGLRPYSADGAGKTTLMASSAAPSASESFPSCIQAYAGRRRSIRDREKRDPAPAREQNLRILNAVAGQAKILQRIAYKTRFGSSESATTTIEAFTMSQCGDKERRRRGEGHCGLRAAI